MRSLSVKPTSMNSPWVQVLKTRRLVSPSTRVIFREFRVVQVVEAQRLWLLVSRRSVLVATRVVQFASPPHCVAWSVSSPPTEQSVGTDWLPMRAVSIRWVHSQLMYVTQHLYLKQSVVTTRWTQHQFRKHRCHCNMCCRKVLKDCALVELPTCQVAPTPMSLLDLKRPLML